MQYIYICMSYGQSGVRITHIILFVSSYWFFSLHRCFFFLLANKKILSNGLLHHYFVPVIINLICHKHNSLINSAADENQFVSKQFWWLPSLTSKARVQTHTACDCSVDRLPHCWRWTSIELWRCFATMISQVVWVISSVQAHTHDRTTTTTTTEWFVKCNNKEKMTKRLTESKIESYANRKCSIQIQNEHVMVCIWLVFFLSSYLFDAIQQQTIIASTRFDRHHTFCQFFF